MRTTRRCATTAPRRVRRIGYLGAAIAARADHATALAAHYLRLAACGHFGADLHRLRHALVASHGVARVGQMADDALAAGATSGADLVAGLLAGVSAWLPGRSLSHDE